MSLDKALVGDLSLVTPTATSGGISAVVERFLVMRLPLLGPSVQSFGCSGEGPVARTLGC